MVENNESNDGLEAVVRQGIPHYADLLRAAWEAFEKVERNLGTLKAKLEGCTTDFDRQTWQEITDSARQKIKGRISAALSQKPDIETYPPAVVQFYVSSAGMLSEDCYVLEFAEHQWKPNPDYRALTVTPLRIDRAIFDPPVQLSVIYNKEDRRISD